MPMLDNFLENVRSRMELKGWNQRELADKSGLHFTTINRILNGNLDPSLETCERLAKSLGMNPEKSFQKIA